MRLAQPHGDVAGTATQPVSASKARQGGRVGWTARPRQARKGRRCVHCLSLCAGLRGSACLVVVAPLPAAPSSFPRCLPRCPTPCYQNAAMPQQRPSCNLTASDSGRPSPDASSTSHCTKEVSGKRRRNWLEGKKTDPLLHARCSQQRRRNSGIACVAARAPADGARGGAEGEGRSLLSIRRT